MKPGDLVRLDVPGQRVHGKLGLIVERVISSEDTWISNVTTKRFSYEVLVEGNLWRCSYEDLLEQEFWDDRQDT